MFGIGFPEFVVLLVILLIVFKPEQLAEMARVAGRLAGQLREMGQRAREEMERELSMEPESRRQMLRQLEPPPREGAAPHGDAPER